MTRRGGLEDGCRDTCVKGQGRNLGVIKVEENYKQDVDKVQKEDDVKEDPGRAVGEQHGVASARVVEEEGQRLLGRGVFGRNLGHGPNS